MSDVVTKRGTSMQKLSKATLNDVAPCKKVSEKYKFISTMDYLKPFFDKGWKVRQERGGKSLTSKHIMHLKHENYKTNQGDYLELVVINSHDRSCAFSVGGGLFRLVCDNGLMVGEDFESFKFRHVGVGIEEKLENSYEKIVAKLDNLRFKFETLSTLEVEADVLQETVSNIGKRLFEKDTRKESVELVELYTRGLANVRREGDRSKDTFTLMNRIQENITRVRGISAKIRITNKENGMTETVIKRIRPTESGEVGRDKKVQEIITSEFFKLVG